MKRHLSICFSASLILLCGSLMSQAQSWSGIIDPSRAIDWSNAGIPGGILRVLGAERFDHRGLQGRLLDHSERSECGPGKRLCQAGFGNIQYLGRMQVPKEQRRPSRFWATVHQDGVQQRQQLHGDYC